DEVARLEFADLKVAARRDMRAAAAEIGREIGETVQLPGVHLAGRDAQAHHETVLGRRDVEQTEVLEAIHVLRIGELVLDRVLEQAIPGVERVLLVLPALFLAEIVDWRAVESVRGRREREVARCRGRGGIGGELAVRRDSDERAGRLQSGEEAL